MPSFSAMCLMYNCIFLSWPVDQEATICEQMEDPVTY